VMCVSAPSCSVMASLFRTPARFLAHTCPHTRPASRHLAFCTDRPDSNAEGPTREATDMVQPHVLREARGEDSSTKPAPKRVLAVRREMENRPLSRSLRAVAERPSIQSPPPPPPPLVATRRRARAIGRPSNANRQPAVDQRAGINPQTASLRVVLELARRNPGPARRTLTVRDGLRHHSATNCKPSAAKT